MPELPEVEIIKNNLAETIVNKKILEIQIYNENMIQYPTQDVFEDGLSEKTIKAVDRRGKYLIIHLSGEKYLVMHLRMTGQIVVNDSKMHEKYLRACFKLTGGLYMYFYDKRKLGTVALLSKQELKEWKSLAELGPDPLQKDFSFIYFKNCLLNSKRPVKNLLLDQKIIAGLGNIYADEALFGAGVNPFKSSQQLVVREMEALFFSIRMVLNEGIIFNGTSFSDYVDINGEKGSYQNELNVYQRAGDECTYCGEKIKRVKLAGRSTFFCPSCQPSDSS